MKSDNISVIGENVTEVNRVTTVLESLLHRIRKGERIQVTDVNYAIRASGVGERDTLGETGAESIPVFSKRGVIRPKTAGQQRYVEAIKHNDLVFGIGPAGTGKTYLAMAMAVSALKSGQVSRIILTRPAVEAGEKLGFLPGDIADKVHPYLRPLYDALYDMMPPEALDKYIERNVIEVAPIAFMRGRTLNNSFVVLDEAQNATIEQMKMFLTRLGFDSKAVVTGDNTQTDLPTHKSLRGLQTHKKCFQESRESSSSISQEWMSYGTNWSNVSLRLMNRHHHRTKNGMGLTHQMCPTENNRFDSRYKYESQYHF